MNIQFFKKQKSKLVLAIATTVLLACGGSGGGGSSANNGGSSNPYIADLTNNVGLKSFNSGVTGKYAAESTALTGSSNPNGTYTLSWVNKTLSSGSWNIQTPASLAQYYVLTSGGAWATLTSYSSATITENADGTVSWNDPSYGSLTATPVSVDLSGANINTGKDYLLSLPTSTKTVKVGLVSPVDANGNSAPAPGVIASNAVYPANSKEWLLNGIKVSQDSYSIYGSGYVVTTPSGNITAISTPSQFVSFSTGNPLCVPGYKLAYLGNINSNTSRFNIYVGASGACTPIVAGTTPVATVDLTFTIVRGQPVVQMSNCTLVAPNSFIQTYPSGSITAFIASINGMTYWGSKRPTNFVLDETTTTAKYGSKNKIAMDAVMTAAGLPTF